MADKMMRIAGRDPSGNAKNISVDGDGKQIVFDGQAHLLLENLQQETTQLQTKVQEVTDRLNQTLDTQLTGSNVKESIIINRSVRDTNTIRTYDIYVSKNSNFTIFLRSSLDAEMTVTFYAPSDDKAYKMWDGAKWGNVSTTIPAHAGVEDIRYDLSSFFDFINEKSFSSFSLRLKCNTTPTKGTIDLDIVRGRM